jgi:GTP 3',8-cyclase
MPSQIKPSYDDKRQTLADVIPLRTPLAIQIAPSSICNFQCNYCIQSSPTMTGKQMMDWDIFVKLCGQIKEFDDKLKQITIAGWGEPLVNKSLPKMIAYMKKADIAENISLVTNASLFNPKYALSIIDSGIDFIKISLQGVTSEKYLQTSSVKLDFDELVKNIGFLYKNKKNCKIFVKVADISLGSGDKEKFYSTFKNITDRMYIETIRPMFDNLEKSVYLENKKFVSKFGQDHPPVIVCPQPFYMMCVSPSGDVLPCCSYYDPLGLGNITEITIKEMWHGKKLKSFLKMLLDNNRTTQNSYPVCQKCTIPDAVVLPGDELDLHADKLRKKF